METPGDTGNKPDLLKRLARLQAERTDELPAAVGGLVKS